MLKSFMNRLFNGKSRKYLLALFDAGCFFIVAAFYYLLSGKVEYSTPVNELNYYIANSLLLFVILEIFRIITRTYKNVWRYTNTDAYVRLVVSDAAACLVFWFTSRYIVYRFFIGFYLGCWFALTVTALNTLLVLVSRFVYRMVYKAYNKKSQINFSDIPKVNIAIVGAGELGVCLARELTQSKLNHYNPVCFIDSNPAKIGNRVMRLPVYSDKDAAKIFDKYQISDVVIAIKNINVENTKHLWEYYSAIGCTVKIYDSPFHESKDENEKQKRVIRDFSIEDLLFRNPLDINSVSEFNYYKGKRILVTGGGGSIGSELCRQIAKCNPKQLVIFDIYENNAYEIEQELRRKYGESLDLAVEIGSVRDCDRLECIFDNYRPEIVFHAAAHKHVPLMEHSQAEAIKNNVIGTYNTANYAEKYGVEKFILISTDKAVNPTNVMGASKRLCEMVIQCRNDSKTSFAAVRFGNVLGSNGSVIPLFKKQILSGGPVTITDKRIIRYFMTIPEASQLVMLAGAKAQKGELFVLDMGQPVRIYDLALNMITLMGYRPNRDIEIKEIGLRPGEKLYEELLMKGENTIKTDNDMIFIEMDKPCTRQEVEEKLAILKEAVENSKHEVNSNKVKEAIKATVPTFAEPDEVNKNAADSKEVKNCKVMAQ